MSEATIVRIDEVRTIERGSGITTRPLIVKERTADAAFATGISRFPPRQGAPTHSHNCGEQVTVLEGEAEVEVGGVINRLKQYDTTYIPANVPHRFANASGTPLVFMWIYGANQVTRTFTDSGETVEHLSQADMLGSS